MTLRPLSLPLVAAAVTAAAFSLPASAVTTVSVGHEYTTGKYGLSQETNEHVIPFGLKHEDGPWTFKFTVPWVSVDGPGVPGNARSGGTGRQSGLGDVTVSGFYNIYNNPQTTLGVDVGLKAKFATADKAKTSLTTGENDYSVQADFYSDFKPIANTTAFGSLGWTKKGDPNGIDYRNPFYGSIGFSNKLSSQNSWGVAYDYRQKVIDGRDPVSEASIFFTHRYSQVLKIQAYALKEVFSDSSPDLGVGFNVFYSF